MQPTTAPSRTYSLLHRIQGSKYVDFLAKGLPSRSEIGELRGYHRYQVFASCWPGQWVVRVWTG